MKPVTIIIISYNRSADALELLQNISTLNNTSTLLDKVIIVNNASTEDYHQVKTFAQNRANIPFQYIDAPENLGVTKGRNFALQFAESELLLFLDDDAVLENKDALDKIIECFKQPGFHDREIAILSLKVLYYSNHQVQKNALPHKQFNKYKNKTAFFTYYFAGCANVIKRKALTEAGNFPEEFFYGMEEYDLSYRILDQGYCILYSSSIVLLHKESPSGRLPHQEKLRKMWVNKSKVAWRYLPKLYYFTTAFMWSLQYLKETKFNLGGYFKGWKEVLSIPKKEKRNPVSEASLQYLRSVEARLWY